MRLTYKRGSGILVENTIPYGIHDGVCYQDCVNKVGEYEDIEKELGIDIITLFKAIQRGFYYSVEYEDELEEGYFKLNNTSMQIDFDKKAFIIEHQIFIYFKDYGKTWALTKEELL